MVPRSEEVLDVELITLANFLDACQCGRGGEVNFCPVFFGGRGEGNETAAAVWNFFSLRLVFLANNSNSTGWCYY